MKRNLITLLCLLFGVSLAAQDIDLTKKKTTAVRLDAPIDLDGQLDEAIWQTAPVATDLVEFEPNPGQTPEQRSEIRVAYDDTGIYIGARLYDSAPDSILQELSQRDNLGNTDWFGVFLSPYRDGINGAGFIVTPANIQFDAKYSSFGEDEGWDAVWESTVSKNSEGWVVEMHIPYSALRFPEVEKQLWQINFGRTIRRYNEKSFWSEIEPTEASFLDQFGYLGGIENIKSPIRLQATPYVAAYVDNLHDVNASPKNTSNQSLSGGMDIKYGINDAFTLDMTLIPDFGEARSDDQVLNLSPFEVRFQENRPFFTEGTELFNKGGLFYSRRVGGRTFERLGDDDLAEGETFVDNPNKPQLLNASKVSGRTEKGLGIGFFNAIEGREYATIRNELGQERQQRTNPLTNYSILALDQTLPNNSYVSLLNTLVMREGAAYDAHVTGGLFELRTKNNQYAIEGGAKMSRLISPDETDTGYANNLNFGKIGGNFNWRVGYNFESENYNPNDLGFLYSPNERTFWTRFNYSIYEPFGPFNRMNSGVSINYARLHRPDEFTSWSVNWWIWAQGKNFWNYNVWTYQEPETSYDYFEPRVDGWFVRDAAFRNYGFSLSTDSRKRFRWEMNMNFGNVSEKNRYGFNYWTGPRFRFNDRLTVSLQHHQAFNKNSLGWVNDFVDGPNSETPGQQHIMFGYRDQHTISNVLFASYNFNAKMALTFRMRHYWSKAEYSRFRELESDGGLAVTDYTGDHDREFNGFNIDMIYRWRFAPGSDIIVVWKNDINQGQWDVPNDQIAPDYNGAINALGKLPQRNSLSVKVLYFLDYVNFMKSRG